uniref:Uncharacterized protein n=1 Tax=Neolamprologus brichardi TaxID=32507 RepID=A0A3Q4FZT4_NEOBR
MACALAFFVLFSAALTSLCDGGKVLIFPVDGSHWLHMKVLVEALHSRGQQITLIHSSTSWYICEVSSYYTSITITQEQSQNIERQDFMASFLKTSLEIRHKSSLWTFVEFYSLFKMVHENHQTVTKLVRRIFENKTLIKELNETGYHLFLTHLAFPGVLGALLAPTPLSYVPVLFSHNSDKMDFFHPSIHSLILFRNGLFPKNQKYILSQHNDLHSLLCCQSMLPTSADLWLMRIDFTFEFPRPTMPNIVYIGGFQDKPSKLSTVSVCSLFTFLCTAFFPQSYRHLIHSFVQQI